MTFTKEQLIEHAQAESATLKAMIESGVYSSEVVWFYSRKIELNNIALAALTADATMYASEETLICAQQGEFLLRTLNRPAGDATIPLYRLPLLEGLK